VIVIGNRSLLIYGIRPQAGRQDDSIQVSVGRERGWRVAGMFASTDAPDVLADRLLDGGLERAVRPLAEGREGAITLSWVAGRPTRTPPTVTGAPGGIKPRPKAAKKSAKKATKKASKKSSKKAAKKKTAKKASKKARAKAKTGKHK